MNTTYNLFRNHLNIYMMITQYKELLHLLFMHICRYLQNYHNLRLNCAAITQPIISFADTNQCIIMSAYLNNNKTPEYTKSKSQLFDFGTIRGRYYLQCLKLKCLHIFHVLNNHQRYLKCDSIIKYSEVKSRTLFKLV